MKTRTTFASQGRLNAILFCSASIFLTACGGTADPMNEQVSAAQAVVADADTSARAPAPIAAAPEAVSSTEATAAVTPDTSTAVVTAAPAPASVAVEATPATADAAPATGANFDLSGYDSQPQAADAAQAPQ